MTIDWTAFSKKLFAGPRGRGPRQIVLASMLAGGLVACGATLSGVAATDSDGDKYGWCVKVVQPISPLKSRVLLLGCSTVESELQQFDAQAQALVLQNPGSVARRVAAK
jgi:hypothetical protein